MDEFCTIRPELLAFAALMERRLRAHDADKGDSYKGMSAHDLAAHALTKAILLEEAVAYGQYTVGKHAADLANYAMMIARQHQAVGRNAPHIAPDELPQ